MCFVGDCFKPPAPQNVLPTRRGLCYPFTNNLEAFMDNQPVRLWIAGSVGIDDITTPRETRANQLGGSVSYACAAASFFTRVGAVGITGEDFPPEFTALYQKFGIDLAGMERVPGRTFRWTGEYHEDMISRTTLKTDLGVLERFNPKLPAHYRAAPYVFLGNMQPQTQLALLDQAEGRPFVALDTMNLWINIAREPLLRVMKNADVLLLNDEEARLLSGLHHLRDCAEAILEMGPKNLVIKKGEHGALLFTPGAIAIVPAYPVRCVADPTGAGDTYAGAFMGFLARENKPVTPRLMRDALLHAAVAASFGVEDFSLNALENLTPEKIGARFKDFAAMIDP